NLYFNYFLKIFYRLLKLTKHQNSSFLKFQWDRMILDEVHYVKRSSGSMHKAVKDQIKTSATGSLIVLSGNLINVFLKNAKGSPFTNRPRKEFQTIVSIFQSHCGDFFQE